MKYIVQKLIVEYGKNRMPMCWSRVGCAKYDKCMVVFSRYRYLEWTFNVQVMDDEEYVKEYNNKEILKR